MMVQNMILKVKYVLYHQTVSVPRDLPTPEIVIVEKVIGCHRIGCSFCECGRVTCASVTGYSFYRLVNIV